MAEQSKKTTTLADTNKAVGRPTKLTEELLERAALYVGQCIAEVPTKEGFALYLGVSRSTVYEWVDLDTDHGRRFSDIFDDIMAEQAKRIINGALYGRFNATISKLMLTKHDYTDKVQTDLTTNGKDLPVPILGGVTQEAAE